jgi:hypothetical protein
VAGVLTHPIVIIGCGPAGLAAAAILQQRAPTREVILVDAGAPLSARDRYHPRDLVSGVGGAGLYSDGKLSFYPSASGLWRLLDPPRLERAYSWLRETLSSLHTAIPSLPLLGDDPQQIDGYKPYPSIYVSLEERHRLIEKLSSSKRILTRTRLVDLRKISEGFLLSFEDDSGATPLIAKAVLLAGGRFSPLLFSRLQLKMRFLRLELGLRLEGPSPHPFFSQLRERAAGSLDPKLIWRDEHAELRTFCFCADGEIVAATHEEYWALSGRADCPPTGKSNIGLLLRLLQPPADFSLASLHERAPFSLPLSVFVEGASPLYSPSMDAKLRGFVLRLLESFPSLQPNIEMFSLHGPVIEGVGEYPVIDGNLSIDTNLFVAGDACGVFRGLVAAMLSGAYVGEALSLL